MKYVAGKRDNPPEKSVQTPIPYMGMTPAMEGESPKPFDHSFDVTLNFIQPYLRLKYRGLLLAGVFSRVILYSKTPIL